MSRDPFTLPGYDAWKLQSPPEYDELGPEPEEDELPSVCSICQDEYTGFGNNAWPVNVGRCCDDCNSAIVIPARIRALR